MTHLTFKLDRMTPSGRTKVWSVESPRGVLGKIRWFSHWRRYGLFPNPGTVWDSCCLKEVATFLDDEMAKYEEGQ